MLPIKKTSEKSITPKKGSKCAAGYDLYSIEDSITLQHSERKLFKTGIHIKIPDGFYGRIAPRSGLALKSGIDVMAGVIDSDYIGEIGVILINLNNMPTVVDTTKPIAQLIIEKCFDVEFQEVDDLAKTARGSGGFGSTDKITETKPTLGYNPNSVPIVEGMKKLAGVLNKYNEAGGISVKEKYTEELKKREQQ